jgi:tetratricopeptide (TPR) repeat protein
MECPRLTCLLRCSLAFALLAGGLQGADPVMEAYNRAWALSEQTTTRGQAIDQLKAIIETNPRLWQAYETLVHTYVLAGQVGQGEAYFRKLIARDQTNAYTHFGLGILLKGAQRYREAVEELTLCLRKDPKMFVCYSTLPEAMNMLLKRPASLEELRGRVPQFSTEPVACVGRLRAHLLMRTWGSSIRGFETCLETAKASGDPDFEWYVIRWFNGTDGNAQAAIARWQEQLQGAVARGDAERQLETLNSFGWWMEQQGHLQEAEEYLNRALTLAKDWGALVGLVGALDGFAKLYRVGGDMEQTIRAGLEAVHAAKATGDALLNAYVAKELGLAYRTAGQLDEAMQWLEEALAVVRGIQNRREEAFLLRDAAMVDADTGNYWKALERMQEAARMFHELGLSHPEGATIGHLPMIYGPLGDYEAALRTARQGLESAYANHDPLMEQRIVEHVGTIYLRLGKPGQALPYLEKSISLTPQTKAMHLHLNA